MFYCNTMSEDRARKDLEFALAQAYNEIRYARRRLIEEYGVVYTELAQTARNCRKANVGAAAVSCAGGVTGAVAVGAGIALGPVAWVAAAGAAALGLAAGGAATAVGTSITEGCINHSLLKRLEAASQHEADMLQLLEELIAKANTNLRISAQQVAKIILAPLLKSALQSGAMIAAGRTVPNLVCGEAAKVAGNLSDETAQVVGQGIVKASTKQVAGKTAPTFGANAAKYGAVVVKYAGPVISVGAAAYSVYDLVVQCNELYADKPAELAEVVKKMKIALEKQFEEYKRNIELQQALGFSGAKP